MNTLNVQGGHHPPDQKRQGPLNLDGSAAPMERYSDTRNDTPAQDSTQAPDATGAHVVRSTQRPKRLNPTSKRAGVLRVLQERGSRGLTCFEAVPLAHDYVLRSTISDLVRGYGFRFHRQDERVPGFGGSLVACVRYTLTPEDEALARDLLADVGAA